MAAKKRSRVVDEELLDGLMRTVAALRRRVMSVERKLVALEKRLSAPVDLEQRIATPPATMTADGLVMIRGVPHLVDCMLVQQPLFGERACTCGSLGTREQRRS